MNEVTRLLVAIDRGDPSATDDLFPIVYDELRRLAAAKLARESPGQTLQATALVHEAYLRLLGGERHDRSESGDTPVESRAPADRSESPAWQSRGHFFAAAAEAMRRILVEQARRKHRIKRGGDRVRVELEVAEIAVEPPSDDILALDEALAKLESEHKTKAEVVKLRYFAGLTIEDTAAALGISTPTVKRYWAYARAWLLREISKGDE
jgi:RNA polymerase sigma factor (sigma-70 family)